MFNKLKENSKLFYVLSDQAIVSLGNFTISVLILRFIGIQEFGIFAFVMLNMYFLSDLQLSGIISPMLTNEPKEKKLTINYFYGSIFLLQILFATLSSIFLYLIFKNLSFLISDYQLSNYAFSIMFLIFFSQLNQFLRRLLMSKKRFIRPILSDLVTYLAFFASFVYYYNLQSLYLEKIFHILTISFFLGFLFNISLIAKLNFSFDNFIVTTKKNWIISKWLMLTSLTGWFSRNLWVIYVGAILGPYIFGVVRSCQIIINFRNVFFQSFENFYPSIISKLYVNKGRDYMKKYINKFIINGAVLSIFISTIVAFFSEFILMFVYGDDVAKYSWILIILTLIVPLEFIKFAPTFGLRTLGNTKPIFLSLLISFIFALLFAKFIIQNYEINGFLFGLITTEILISSTVCIGFYNLIKKTN